MQIFIFLVAAFKERQNFIGWKVLFIGNKYINFAYYECF
jgi:hypothetical protein